MLETVEKVTDYITWVIIRNRIEKEKDHFRKVREDLDKIREIVKKDP